jgi:hypothetical protein
VLADNLFPCSKCSGTRYEKFENEKEILYLGCSHCFGLGFIDWIDNILGVNTEQMNNYLKTSNYKELFIPCTKKLEKTIKIKNFRASLIVFDTDKLYFLNNSKIIFENCAYFFIKEVDFIDKRTNNVGPLISIIGRKDSGKGRLV